MEGISSSYAHSSAVDYPVCWNDKLSREKWKARETEEAKVLESVISQESHPLRRLAPELTRPENDQSVQAKQQQWKL